MQIVEGTRLGAYRIVRKLGEGGMGAVFEGVHERLQKRVAIKTLHEAVARDADAVARFVREGRAASRIRHPHVVDVTDVGVEEGTPFLVMELLEGESVASLLARNGPLPIPAITEIALPVLDALQAAHAAGIVHRDLKPENIFLSRARGVDLHPIVLDFGISWIADEVRLTKTAHFMGTPYYMSPEQAQSARSVDARSDQFSLGLVLFELVTGRRALSGSSVLEVVHRVSNEGAPRLSQLRPDLPYAFTSIVDRMTERHPAARFGSMREIGAALLPYASPRAVALWSATFAGGAPSYGGAPQASYPPTHGTAQGSLAPQSVQLPSFSQPAFSHPSHAQGSPRASSQRPPSFSAPVTGGLATDPTVSAQPRSPLASSAPPTTTTLRGAARESVDREPRKRGGSWLGPVVAVLAVAAVLGAVGAAFLVGASLSRQDAAVTPEGSAAPTIPAAIPPAPPGPAPAQADANIEVRLRAVPATAEILLDGAVVANGSYAGSLRRDGIPHVLEVRAPGYIPHTIQFLDIAPIAQIVLDPIPRHHRGPIEPRRSAMTEAGLVAAPAPTAPLPEVHAETAPTEVVPAATPVSAPVEAPPGAASPAATPEPAPLPEPAPTPEPAAPAPAAPEPAPDPPFAGEPIDDLIPFE